MTYHDRLLSPPSSGHGRRKNARVASAVRGVELITLFPESPLIRLGTIADDWRSVGADIRSAMRKFEKHD